VKPHHTCIAERLIPALDRLRQEAVALETAHVPVIWATQVLETMARRAEVSDAAKGIRAECVMLNKVPYIVETAQFLCGVLERMSDHQSKHRPMMRRLAVSTLPEERLQAA
jgi:pyruvate kinase